jgi:orotidine-5'-phosphate decarboxylase
MPTAFADLLDQCIIRAGSPICVGLDPVVENLPADCRRDHPADAIEAFSLGVIDAVRDGAAAIKPQSACFERYGSRGFAALERTCAHARAAGLAVVLDGKRGDIGISASHYAASAVAIGAHAVTVNGYLGLSGIEPFLTAGLGVFVLVRTSNPDSDAVQSARLADDRSVAEHVGGLVATLGTAHRCSSGVSSVGAVVGATKSADGRALRAAMPDQVFLVPGYGAQGGAADDIRALLRPASGGRGASSGVLVTASRSIIYAKPAAGESWLVAVGRAAKGMAAEIAQILR